MEWRAMSMSSGWYRIIVPTHKTLVKHKQKVINLRQLIYSISTKNGGSNRRSFGFLSSLLLGCFPAVSHPALLSIAKTGEEQLGRYTDTMEGFTLLRPTSWAKVEKAGAVVLFEEVNQKGNNIGVVVNPIRLSSLGDFGSPQFVADKLIQAELRKESTKNAEVIGVGERLGHGGLQVYEFEYKVDSTRVGMKRIFSAVFVASKKLYLLNVAYSDRPENPLDAQTRMVLEQVLHSFDTSST